MGTGCAKPASGDPETIRADTQAAVATPAEKRSEVQKYLATKFEPSLRVSSEEVTAALSPADRSQAAELNTTSPRSGHAPRAGQDPGDVRRWPAPPTHLLKRGNYETPGRGSSAGFLEHVV